MRICAREILSAPAQKSRREACLPHDHSPCENESTVCPPGLVATSSATYLMATGRHLQRISASSCGHHCPPRSCRYLVRQSYVEDFCDPRIYSTCQHGF